MVHKLLDIQQEKDQRPDEKCPLFKGGKIHAKAERRRGKQGEYLYVPKRMRKGEF